jgi:HPt (histidine-containing phosphotransfer) domain-containing protein
MDTRHPLSEPALNRDELFARVDNDRELLQELIVIFKDHFPQQLCALRRAVDQGDLKTVERSSHTLKGMFLSLAASKSAAAASQLERLGRGHETGALSNALALLEREVALLLPELEAHLTWIKP